MKIPKREQCIHVVVCKYDDGMCPCECGHFEKREREESLKCPMCGSELFFSRYSTSVDMSQFKCNCGKRFFI